MLIHILIIIIQQNTDMIMIKNLKLSIIFFLFLFTGSSISPGMQEPSSSIFGGKNIYIKEKDIFVPLIDIDESVVSKLDSDFSYTVSPGDVLTFVVWGLDDIFPITNLGVGYTNPQTSRTVNTDGTIFFPYAGIIKVEGLSISEVRNLVIELISDQFVDPQIDITVTQYNQSRKAYLLGEVYSPHSFYVGIEKISITDAIGTAKGLDPRYSNAKEVYLIRDKDKPSIYKLNLQSPDKFLLANEIYVRPGDIIYVSASGVTKWNRFFAQIFPFAGFLNQLDNINDD